MRSVVPMRTAKIGYIVVSVIMCVLGIAMIAVPDFSISLIGITLGAVFIVFGTVRLVGYFSKDLYRLAFQYDLAFGIMMIALGAIMLFRPASVMTFVCIALGLSVLADGLFKMQIAIDSKQFGIGKWWLILILAIVTVVIGVTLIARPSDSSRVLTALIGVSLLCDGVLNISTVITAVKIIKHQKADVIEMDYHEEREE